MCHIAVDLRINCSFLHLYVHWRLGWDGRVYKGNICGPVVCTVVWRWCGTAVAERHALIIAPINYTWQSRRCRGGRTDTVTRRSRDTQVTCRRQTVSSTVRAVFKGVGVTGSNPLRNYDERNFDVSFSQCFLHISLVVVQCRSVYANFKSWQLIDYKSSQNGCCHVLGFML